MESDEINARFREVWAELKMQSAYVRKQADRLDALKHKWDKLLCGALPPAPPVPKPATETVGERIAMQCAFWEKRRECAAAIDATVKEANARAEKAEAEVKRLSDAGWIETMASDSIWSADTFRAHFARHVKGGGA